MSLYTKYRPRDWDSVIGQDAISTILRNSLIQDRVGHAYILTGSRGTGKTTSARILAKGVNCTNLQNGNPCHECGNCQAFDNGSMLDVIEIDGASNNGVENVRELIEKARFEPNQGKYKVYIIDEVHMLSTGAFNALLKTLEEPPKHVKFILATTEIDKVPETIRSRSLQFDFQKINETDIIKRLEYVTRTEGITAEAGALAIIAKAARGALRDALTLTEQNTINGEISTEYVRSSLALLEDDLIDAIIGAFLTGSREEIMRLLDTLKTRHVQVRGLFDQILYTLRDRLFEALSENNMPLFVEYESIFAVFEAGYSKIKVIPDGLLLIEITFLRAIERKSIIQNAQERTQGVKKEGVQGKEQPNIATKIQPKNTKEEIPENTISEIPSPKIEAPKESPENTKSPKSNFSYIALLNALKLTRAALLVDLKNARFELTEKDDGTKNLKLIFAVNWNYERINTIPTKSHIIETLEATFGKGWSLECALDARSNTGVVDEVF